MNDKSYEFFSTKSRILIICKTPGMWLWVGLSLIGVDPYHEEKNFRRQAYKEAIKKWPYEVSDCRCKDCRYCRFAKRNRQ